MISYFVIENNSLPFHLSCVRIRYHTNRSFMCIRRPYMEIVGRSLCNNWVIYHKITEGCAVKRKEKGLTVCYDKCFDWMKSLTILDLVTKKSLILPYKGRIVWWRLNDDIFSQLMSFGWWVDTWLVKVDILFFYKKINRIRT